MRKACFVFFLVLFFIFPGPVLAITDPLSVPNNKFGIHILFPSELLDAVSLVNSNGGDFGYVTIPIQAGDKDLEKWQVFMDTAKQYHMIPIIRLATEGDYFNTKVWRKPQEADILDFANFLNSLEWPTKNRYVIVFNEVNRSDEWGGKSNPSEYAQLLSYAVSVFKSKSDDFFMITAGMDNASITAPGMSFNQFDFLRSMNLHVPGIFNQVDGLSSHSYPNPAFSKPPSKQDSMSIASFRFEKAFIEKLAQKTFPVFITETGWAKDKVSEDKASEYYKEAFETVWSDPGIVAVTPFLLKAGSGPFVPFSFFKPDGTSSKEFVVIAGLSKTAGTPVMEMKKETQNIQNTSESIVSDFSNESVLSARTVFIPQSLKIFLKWLLKL